MERSADAQEGMVDAMAHREEADTVRAVAAMATRLYLGYGHGREPPSAQVVIASAASAWAIYREVAKLVTACDDDGAYPESPDAKQD